MANSDVKLKHKVQLRRKVEEPTDEKPIVDPVPHSTRETSKSKMWIWVLVGIVVLLIIGYFIFTRSENTVQTPIEVESTFVPSDTNESIKVTSEETYVVTIDFVIDVIHRGCEISITIPNNLYSNKFLIGNQINT